MEGLVRRVFYFILVFTSFWRAPEQTRYILSLATALIKLIQLFVHGKGKQSSFVVANVVHQGQDRNRAT